VNSKRISDFIKGLSKGKEDQLDEIVINTIDHEKKILSVSTSFIKEKTGTVREILFICKDVTIEKEAHGKLFKGNSYLITDQSENKTDIFTSLLGSGYKGLYIGRTSKENIQVLFRTFSSNFINLLSEGFKQKNGKSHLDELYKKIEGFLVDSENKNSLIFLDRLDYLITIHSFENVIKWLYNINELVIKYKALMFLCINPDIFNETQLEFIKMEFKELPSQSITEVSLDETQYEILKFINFENNQNALINYRDVGKRFNISKVTVKKRLDSLTNLGLIYSQKHGRSKYINITMKGKNILSHREAI
jgi:DNA-binding MarR family transcriptional regulator